MAKVMICDDDRAMAELLVNALRDAGHEAETCRHTMDMLRGAEAGQFDLIAFGLDMAGFVRGGAVEALHELAPRVPLIALHERPSEIIRTTASDCSHFAAVLPRSLAVEDFMYAVACALNTPTTRRREPAA
jgi:DNA-binding NtrC family response regulator